MNQLPDSTTPPPIRIPKRIGIPVLLIAMVAGLLLWGTIRGNWTDSEARNPASAADGVVTQLLRTADGRKPIRAAVVVNVSPDRFWKVVTNYDHFAEIFPNVSASHGVLDPDGRWHVTGEVHSLVGHWPMELHVQHVESPVGCTASWDEPHGVWTVNRGSWGVTQIGPEKTLLQYNLELKVSPFPAFVVRAVLLDQLKTVLRAVANRAERGQPSH